MPGGTPKPLGRLLWSLPSGTPLTPQTAPPMEALLKPGTVTLLSYGHDDDCPQLSGGACQCDPDMAIYEFTREDDIA